MLFSPPSISSISYSIEAWGYILKQNQRRFITTIYIALFFRWKYYGLFFPSWFCCKSMIEVPPSPQNAGFVDSTFRIYFLNHIEVT